MVVEGESALMGSEFGRGGGRKGLSEETGEELVPVIVADSDSLLVPFFAGGSPIPA